jgi:WD40 repeat protein
LTVAWSPDSSALAIGGSDKIISLFEVEHSEDQKVDSIALSKISEIRRAASISCLKWNYDGSYLAIATQDGSVVIFSITADTRLKEIYRANATSLRIYSLCFSPDGLFLALGGCDSKCVLIEMETYTIVQEIKRGGSVKSIDWVYWPCALDSFPSKCLLAVGAEDATLALLKTGTDDDTSSQYSTDSSDYDSTDGSTITSVVTTKTNDWTFNESSFVDSLVESSKTIVSVAFVASVTNPGLLLVAFGDGRLVLLDLVSTSNWRVIKVSPIRFHHGFHSVYLTSFPLLDYGIIETLERSSCIRKWEIHCYSFPE